MAKIRSAPANEFKIPLNNWDIWVIGCEKLFEYCKKATTVPKSSFLEIIIRTPKIAVMA